MYLPHIQWLYYTLITFTTLVCDWLSSVGWSNSLRLTNMSVPIVADLREEMNLDCHFDLGKEQLYAVKWYKDDHEFFRYVPHQEPHHARSFPVAGVHLVPTGTDCGEEHCKIQLTDLTRDHSGGAYRCEISSEAPTFRLASETRNIAVAALPKENPRIEGIENSYSEGDFLTGKCVSAPADPVPILTWSINGEQAPDKFIGDMMSSEPDSEGLMSRSVSLRFQAERKYTHGDTIKLRCVSTLPGILFPPQTTIHTITLRSQLPQAINNEKLHWNNASNKAQHHIVFVLLVVSVRW